MAGGSPADPDPELITFAAYFDLSGEDAGVQSALCLVAKCLRAAETRGLRPAAAALGVAPSLRSGGVSWYFAYHRQRPFGDANRSRSHRPTVSTNRAEHDG